MQLKDVNWIGQWASSTTETSNIDNNAMLRNIAQLAFVPWLALAGKLLHIYQNKNIYSQNFNHK